MSLCTRNALQRRTEHVHITTPWSCKLPEYTPETHTLPKALIDLLLGSVGKPLKQA